VFEERDNHLGFSLDNCLLVVSLILRINLTGCSKFSGLTQALNNWSKALFCLGYLLCFIHFFVVRDEIEVPDEVIAHLLWELPSHILV